jgi:Lar family restriction alleviation protein
MTDLNGAEKSAAGRTPVFASPCPFCGTDPKMTPMPGPDGDPFYSLVCPSCAVIGPAGETEALALAHWNRRPYFDAAQKAGLEPVTIAAAAALMDVSLLAFGGKLGRVPTFVLCMFDTEHRQLGVHLHALNKAQAAELLPHAVQRIEYDARMDRGGIIIAKP